MKLEIKQKNTTFNPKSYTKCHQLELISEPLTPASEFGRTRKSKSLQTIRVSTLPHPTSHSLRRSVSSVMPLRTRPPEIPPTLSSMLRDLLAASSQTEQSRTILLSGHSPSSLAPVRSLSSRSTSRVKSRSSRLRKSHPWS